jgi:hypothetical protein
MVIDMLLLLADSAGYIAVYRDGEIYIEQVSCSAAAR